ncbi:MAG: zf-TFIIB domain-containing protein [Elusimicrobiota bacterium]
MKCPNCSDKLKDHVLEGKIYHKCPDCEGFWFDKNELSNIKKEKDWFKIDYRHKDSHAEIKSSTLKCPRDNSILKTVSYEHSGEEVINVDVCEKCEGLWLDAGEVYKIHKAEETWLEKIKNTIEEELIAIEVFLAKIGPYLPK